MLDLTTIVQAVIALVAAVITAFVVPILKKRMTADDLATLKYWLGIAVQAAEEYFGSKKGQSKRTYVKDFLESKGYYLDDKELRTYTDAAVYELINQFKKPELPAGTE